MTQSEVSKTFRQWWFNNETGDFRGPDGFQINRWEAHDVGGPTPDFDGCQTCQMAEWLSRVEKEDLFIPHKCPTADECRTRCERQGDDAWTNWHQDHFFAATGVDAELNAPKGALMLREGASQYEWFWKRNCNAGMATFRQKLAFASQADTEVTGACTDWSNYDWIWMVNKGEMDLFERPPLPMVLYCHDMWRGNKQEALDHFQPEIILTPFPTSWQQNFRIPDASQVVFTPACPSPFFARPNLDPDKKKWDLLAIGALGSDFYVPRRELNEQLDQLPDRFKVWHSHEVGSKRARWFGPLDDDTHCYMNRWAEKLAAAKFVIFGPCAGRAKEMLLIKFYECLASGAIPILPEVKDMDHLGIQPMVHYIPFHQVEGNNRVLAHLLDHYENFHYIAKSAVKWYEENAHRLVFESFQNVIEFVTSGAYSKRLW